MTAPPVVPSWMRLAAAVWVVGFLCVFFNQELPNNRLATRWDVWSLTPFVLMDAVDPPQTEASLPRGLRHLGQRLPAWGFAGLLLAGAWGWGRVALTGIAADESWTNLERNYFSMLLGLSLVSLAMLLLGFLGVMSSLIFGCLLTLGVYCAVWPTWRARMRPREAAPAKVAVLTTTTGFPWWWLCIAPFVLGILLGALSPSTDFDVNEYHLGGPKEWFLQGRITFLPHNVYTSFPFLTEMLLLAGMTLAGDWFWGALAGQTVLAAFAPLTAMGLYAAGRRWHSELAGRLAAIVYLSTPWVFRMSIIAYAEGGLTAYTAGAALAAWWVWRRVRDGSIGDGPFPIVPMFLHTTTGDQHAGPFSPTLGEKVPKADEGVFNDVDGRKARVALGGRVIDRPPHPDPLPHGGEGTEWHRKSYRDQRVIDRGLRQGLLLTGLLCGSAMACKYTGLVMTVLPCGVLLGLAAVRRFSPRIVWHGALLFSLGVLVTVGPWLLKNAVETGNPVYPLGYSVFGGRDLDDALALKWKRGHARPSAGGAVAEARDLVMKAYDVAAVNDWQSPLVFAFAMLTLLTASSRRIAVFPWLMTGWVFLSWWLFTHHLDRFWLPLLPTAALLAGMGAAEAMSHLHRWGTIAVLSLGVVFNLGFCATGFVGYNVGLTEINAARAFTARIVGPEIAWINEAIAQHDLPAETKVLLVGEAEVFPAQFPYVYNTVFDRSLFEAWCGEPGDIAAQDRRLRSPEAIRATLAEHGITHIYVNWGEIWRYRQTYGYTDFVHPSRFQHLIDNGVIGPSTAWPNGLGIRPARETPDDAALRKWAPELFVRTADGEAVVTGAFFHVWR